MYHLPARPLRSNRRTDYELEKIVNENIGVLDAAMALKYVAYRLKSLQDGKPPRSTLMLLSGIFRQIETVIGRTPSPIVSSRFSSTAIGLHNQCNIWELSESKEKTCCFLQAYSDQLRDHRDIDHLIESMHVWSVTSYFHDEPSNFHRLARKLMQLAGEHCAGIPLDFQQSLQDESEEHDRRIKERSLAIKCRVSRLDYHLSRHPKHDRPTMAFLLDLVGDFDKAPFIDFCEHLLDEVELRLDTVASEEFYNAAEDINRLLFAGEPIGSSSGSLQTVACYAIDSWENNYHEDIVYYDWDHKFEYIREERHEKSIDGNHEESSALGAIDGGILNNEPDPVTQSTKHGKVETVFNLVHASPATDDTGSEIARRGSNETSGLSFDSPDQAIPPLRLSHASPSQECLKASTPESHTTSAAREIKESKHQEREAPSDRLYQLLAELEHTSSVTNMSLQRPSTGFTTLLNQGDQTASCTATIYEAADSMEDLHEDKIVDSTSCRGNGRRRGTSDSLLDEFETATCNSYSASSSDIGRSGRATDHLELAQVQPYLASPQENSTAEHIDSSDDPRWTVVDKDPDPGSKSIEEIGFHNLVLPLASCPVEEAVSLDYDPVGLLFAQFDAMAENLIHDPCDPPSEDDEPFQPANSSAGSQSSGEFSLLINKLQKSMETLSDSMTSTLVLDRTEKVSTSKLRSKSSNDDSITPNMEDDMRMPGLFGIDGEGKEEDELDRRITASTEAFLENLRKLESEWHFRCSEAQESEQEQ